MTFANVFPRGGRGAAWLAAVMAILLAPAVALKADSIPYTNVGTIAPTHTFTASTDGDIWAYFYGADSFFNSDIGLLVNGVSTGIVGLPNHGSAVGQSIDLGSVHAGQTLVFQLVIPDLHTSYYSDPSMNSDGVNHAYSTAFSGNGMIPAGTYVGFEDLGWDWDYNDFQFVFTNVSTSTNLNTNLGTRGVPEAGSLILLSLALAGLVFQVRRQSASTTA